MEVFYGCLCLLGGVLLPGVFREGGGSAFFREFQGLLSLISLTSLISLVRNHLSCLKGLYFLGPLRP